MARAGTVEVLGVRELVRSFGILDKQLKRGLQKELQGVGEIVRDDVRGYWGQHGATQKTIMGFRVGVRTGNVRVYQRYSPGPTGTRGDFGAKQMASMAFGLKKRGPEVEVAVERILDRLIGSAGF